ncbi:MAG: hypothetical protein HRU20_17135 [Pseudomonadales bacterium]|nr:hypothetical protein [Pseudomonadales bacterium]
MNPVKIFLIIIGIPFVLLEAYWTFAPTTGFVHMYGVLEALQKYFELHIGNSMLMAGLTDFMMVVIVALVWMIMDTPKERRWKPKFFIWLTSYLVIPGLGFLVYFLYLNPDHRFVSSASK